MELDVTGQGIDLSDPHMTVFHHQVTIMSYAVARQRVTGLVIALLEHF